MSSPAVAVAVVEFELTDEDFARVRALVRTGAGIELAESKRALVYGRLSRRLRTHGFARFADYLDFVERNGEEATAFINALTTNVTEFFRETHHFDFLKRSVLPALREAHPNGGRLRFWSAGCSTGEEPYTLAMTIRSAFPHLAGWDIKILATDIDSDVLAHASAGSYSADRLRNVPPDLRERWFTRHAGRPGQPPSFTVKPELRSMITFKQLNLLEPWPMRGPFDAIFCRNVIIYFDNPTKQNLVRRYHALLAPSAYLFLGHSESLVSNELGFSHCGRSAYRRNEPKGAA